MLLVCPNCATSYGVEMASLRLARGGTRQVRCCRYRWVWHAQLSYADKLMVAADAVLPVRRAMLAVAQVAAEAARSTLPRLRRATTILAEELAAANPRPDPMVAADFHPSPSGAERAGGAEAQLTESIAAILVRFVAGLRLPAWSRYGQSWPVAWTVSWRVSWRPSWRRFWHRWRLSLPLRPAWCPALSRLQWVILWFALIDAAIIGCRANLVWAMPQTASFYASLGLPVNLRGIDFDRVAATAERHNGEPVLIVNVEIGNNTSKAEQLPHLRFAIRDAQRQEIYAWTAAPARRSLAAGRTLSFHSELVLPPPDTREVVVRFVDPEKTF